MALAARTAKRLNTRLLAMLTKPGLYAGGDGLNLHVSKADARSWTYRHVAPMAAGQGLALGASPRPHSPKRVAAWFEGPAVTRRVRFRTLGCRPVTAAITAEAEDVAAVAEEALSASTSERRGRISDAGSLARQSRVG